MRRASARTPFFNTKISDHIHSPHIHSRELLTFINGLSLHAKTILQHQNHTNPFMKKFIVAAAVLATFSFTAIEVTNWGIDASHSRLGFTLNHQGIAELQGEFKAVDVQVSASAADFSDAKIELTAQANSIYTGSEGRDGHLQTADFLDAAKFPTITFKSTSMKKVGEKDYIVKGDFTMHGVTKPIELKARHNATIQTKQGVDVAGFKVTGTIKRTDFGVGMNFPSAVASDEMQVNADIEISRK
jgi:polyisoprenoid-binding protein YceI